jgi:hypothetical protein
MIAPLAAIATSKAPGFILLASGFVLATMHDVGDAVPPGTESTLVQMAALFLGAGGIGYLLIKTGMGEYSKSREEQRLRLKEDRDAERADDDRRYADHKDLSARLINAYDVQVRGLRDELIAERRYSAQLVAQLTGKPINHETGPIAKES